MTVLELVKLRMATNRAIDVVKRNRIPGDINWADLSCVQAAWILTDSGTTYAQVTIEEAAPDATALCAAVWVELTKSGWPDVDVITDW